FPRQARIVLQALKEYGMIVSDNGSNWYLSGAPSPKWSNDQLHTLHRVPGSAFEVVDGTKLNRSIRAVPPRPDRIERLPEQYFTTLLARVTAAGPDVIDVGRGNPDVPPPPHVIQALVESAGEPTAAVHGYPPFAGLAAAKQAIADRYAAVYGVQLDPEREVAFLPGTTTALVELALVLAQRGD